VGLGGNLLIKERWMSDEADAVEIIHYLIEDLGVLEDA
jgi:hypothetical protein